MWELLVLFWHPLLHMIRVYLSDFLCFSIPCSLWVLCLVQMLKVLYSRDVCPVRFKSSVEKVQACF